MSSTSYLFLKQWWLHVANKRAEMIFFLCASRDNTTLTSRLFSMAKALLWFIFFLLWSFF